MTNVEVTRCTDYIAQVKTLADAFAFIWDCVEREEIGPDPEITISPFWEPSDDEDYRNRSFTVVVSGTTELTGPPGSPTAAPETAKDPAEGRGQAFEEVLTETGVVCGDKNPDEEDDWCWRPPHTGIHRGRLGTWGIEI